MGNNVIITSCLLSVNVVRTYNASTKTVSKIVNLYLRLLHLIVKHKMSWIFIIKFLFDLLSWQPSVTEHERNDEILVWMLGLVIFNVTCSIQRLK